MADVQSKLKFKLELFLWFKMTTDCHVQLCEESIRSDLLLTVKTKITEKVIKDQNQKSLVKTDLDQKSKITKSYLKL